MPAKIYKENTLGYSDCNSRQLRIETPIQHSQIWCLTENSIRKISSVLRKTKTVVKKKMKIQREKERKEKLRFGKRQIDFGIENDTICITITC